MKTVLFACIHNAGRSQMAAAWFNALADKTKAQAISAGTEPGARVHPEVLQAMREVGIDLEGVAPRKLTDEVAKDVSMHVAAMGPLALNKEELDPAVVEKERQILRDAALAEGKPANIVDKMVEGRLKNFYGEKVLLEQHFVKENSITVGQYAKDKGMAVKKFVHWELGKS